MPIVITNLLHETTVFDGSHFPRAAEISDFKFPRVPGIAEVLRVHNRNLVSEGIFSRHGTPLV